MAELGVEDVVDSTASGGVCSLASGRGEIVPVVAELGVEDVVDLRDRQLEANGDFKLLH